MRKFDTKVQQLKHQVLMETARAAFNDTLAKSIPQIPSIIVPGPKPSMRCCIHKERAIVNERIKLAIGGDETNPNVIEVLQYACDGCPIGGHQVTDSCRGCIAHRCEAVCPKNAITFDEFQRAKIDKSKCINCGLCAKACPYGAIINFKRPCETSCKPKAITASHDEGARVDNDKCTACGSCVYQCPFGAIMDKSYILEVIRLLKKHVGKTYMIVAPSISSQFNYATLGQVITGIKELGFHSVVEVALGADMVAHEEALELSKKKFLMSSCCPAFVQYIKNQFPDLLKHVSENLSPMARIAQYIKGIDADAKVVFVGPCTAKKQEQRQERVRKYVDAVITFEELSALFEAKEIDLTQLSEGHLDNASYFGRIFARTGGLAEAVNEALLEQKADFVLKPVICDGLDACRVALNKVRNGTLDGNFVEGMACQGGCIGGPCCLTHEMKDKTDVDRYGREAKEKTIADAIKVFL
ncbi:MAG: 4Fe-4S dicluster domain-containing protein [Bacteroidia bacterium]|nr:4Fe-4S dicluster domain-containing protein [Bacteroidia bacterium]